MFDFGVNGKPPVNPPLLDWLASELLDGDWQMKRLHRQMVTSHTYRLASATSVSAVSVSVAGSASANSSAQLDPDNLHYWRYTPHRMEAEAVRDATLAAADALDVRLGGVELDPATGLTSARRSLYFRNTKEKKMTFLALFDSPNVVECYKWSESIAPQQALAMANSPLLKDYQGQVSINQLDSLLILAAQRPRVRDPVG